MSYEPSTEDIKAAWCGLTNAPDTFEMWILKERERVMNLAGAVYTANECERIVKLLEGHRDSGARWHVAYVSALTDAIALIKGENK